MNSIFLPFSLLINAVHVLRDPTSNAPEGFYRIVITVYICVDGMKKLLLGLIFNRLLILLDT